MKFDEKPFIKNKWLVVGFVSVTLEREIKSRKHYMKYSKTWMVPKLFLQWQYSDLDFSQHTDNFIKRMIQLIVIKYIREAFQKKINKKCGFFPHWGGGGQPQIHTFLKVWIFMGGGGSWVQFPHFFVQFYFFFKNFVLFYPVFVGWKVIFRVKLKKNFFPPKCVSTL